MYNHSPLFIYEQRDNRMWTSLKMRILNTLLLITTVIALTACGGGTGKRTSSKTLSPSLDIEQTGNLAKDYTQSGKFLDAALLYNKLASISTEPDKQHFQLLAAEVLFEGNYLMQANQLLEEINVSSLSQTDSNRLTLLNARIAVARDNSGMALNILSALPKVLDSETAAKVHATRSEAYAKSGNNFEAARELIFLESFLTDEEEIQNNQVAILSTLTRISDFALQQLITQPPPDTFSGWLELTRITKTYQQKPEELTEELKLWRKRYPTHSALDKSISKASYREQIDIIRPTHIALLLPHNNRFAKAADAIKKGLLSTYFSTVDESERPILQIYNTDDSTENFWTTYNRAIADGADFIIGPLDKAYVTMLNEKSELEVPTLALNYSENNQQKTTNLFQFGLSPEDEAAQAAERAWLNGYSSALVLVPQGKWGQRVYNSFKARWDQLGGTVAEHQTYDAKKNDFSASIRKLLNIDESERRHSQLHATLNHKTFATPRRRQDIDFIFIGAFPRQARQLRPQFKFHHAADLPVYGTSHIFTGKINRQMDRDMNGVFFGDMPWVIPGMPKQTSLKKEISRLWPNINDKYTRLFALGIDAYNLIPSLNRLVEYRADYYSGETGSLYLDENNRVQRRLLWLGFEKGIPKVLDNLN